MPPLYKKAIHFSAVGEAWAGLQTIAPRPIQSLCCDVCVFWVVDGLSRLSATGTKRAGDFWSKSVL